MLGLLRVKVMLWLVPTLCQVGLCCAVMRCGIVRRSLLPREAGAAPKDAETRRGEVGRSRGHYSWHQRRSFHLECERRGWSLNEVRWQRSTLPDGQRPPGWLHGRGQTPALSVLLQAVSGVGCRSRLEPVGLGALHSPIRGASGPAKHPMAVKII